MFVCFMNALKGFDRVNRRQLFDVLYDENILTVFLELFNTGIITSKLELDGAIVFLYCLSVCQNGVQ